MRHNIYFLIANESEVMIIMLYVRPHLFLYRTRKSIYIQDQQVAQIQVTMMKRRIEKHRLLTNAEHLIYRTRERIVEATPATMMDVQGVVEQEEVLVEVIRLGIIHHQPQITTTIHLIARTRTPLVLRRNMTVANRPVLKLHPAQQPLHLLPPLALPKALLNREAAVIVALKPKERKAMVITIIKMIIVLD